MNWKKAILGIRLRRRLLDDKGQYQVRWINLEFNSSCNLRCKWCTLDHQKKREIMDARILEKSLDELANDRGYHIERIDLHNAGETLLHPNLEVMLGIIARKKGGINGRPTVHLLTNAMLLTEQVSKTILESGAIDEIRFSIDGGTKEAYEEIRRGAKWEIVSKNVLKFLELNDGRVKTGVICIVPNEKECSVDWMDAGFKDLFRRIDHVELRRAHNWDGSKDLDIDFTSDESSNGRVCKFLLKQMVILPNGDVTVCCADLNSRGVIGNVFKQALRDIFFSEDRMNMIGRFSKNKKEDIDLCRKCAGYYE